MSMLGTKNPTFKDGRTKQTFKDETDINKIIQRAEKTGMISHLNKHEARYGDFSNFDFFAAQEKLSAGGDIFADLPAEVRREFNQSPAAFFEYVNDPENADRLGQLLPALAEPGRAMPPASGLLNADADTAATAAANLTSPEPEATPVSAPPEGTDASSEGLNPSSER